MTIIFGFNALEAQTIVLPYPANAQDIDRGLNTGLLTVRVAFPSSCSGDTVTIQMPESVTYVAGTVVKTAGSYAIAEADISNLRTPRFEITGVAAGGDITFTIARQAGCGNLASGKDTVVLVGDCGSGPVTDIENIANTNTYNLLAPVFSLTAPPTVTGAIIGRVATRTIKVANGGVGDADTMHFYVVYENGGIENTDGADRLTVNGVSFAPSHTNGDTLFYKFFGATLFGGVGPLPPPDNLFDNGEFVTITEPIKVLACNSITKYAAGWGVNENQICQWALGAGSITMAGGVPNPSVYTYTRDPGYVDMCTSPFYYDITFSNNGTGNDTAAGMYNIDLQLNGFNPTYHSITNARVNGNSVAGFTFSGGILVLNMKDGFPTTDPDGVGVGLEDLDGDGFFDDLPRGNTVVIRIDVSMICNQICGKKDNYVRYRVVRYDNMCGTSIATTSVRNDGIARFIYRSFNGTAKVPANIVGGVPFRMTLGFAHNGASSADLNTGLERYRYKLILPPGYSVSGTGNPTYDGIATTYTQVADTIFITSPSTAIKDAGIDLVLNCAGLSPGTVTFNYEFIWINNITTGCACLGRIKCTSVNSYQHCPTPCTTGGPTTYLPTVRRADGSLGWTDATLTTRQSIGNISAFDLAKALYLDTLQITTSAKQNAAASNLHLELRVARVSAALTPLLSAEMQVKIIRSGITFSCTLPAADDSSTTATEQILDWNLTSCIPGGFLPGDSIYTLAKYVVNHNEGLPRKDIQTGNYTSFYNIDPILGRVGCNFFIPEMYLVGTDAIDGRNGFNSTGCAVANLGGSGSNIARRFNTGGEIFANEYRPVFYVDSLIIVSNYGHDVVSTTILGAIRTPDVVNGKTLTYRNPGNWPLVGLTKTNEYGGSIQYRIQPNCKTPAASNHQAFIYIKDYYYALAKHTTYPSKFTYVLGDGGTLDTINDINGKNSTVTHTAGSSPLLFTQDLTPGGAAIGAEPQETWDINIQNNGINIAGYHWLALETLTGSGITIDSVVNTSTGINLTPKAYGTGDFWYENNMAGIVSSGDEDFRIYFKYTSCNLDSIKLKTGWNCASYPSPDPLLDTLSCSTDSIYLKVRPAKSQIQITVLRQPGSGSPIALCTTDSVIIQVNSAQDANVINPRVEIYPPTGSTIATPIAVEYPYGSNIYQNATTTAIPGGYLVELSSHTGIGSDGLPGLIKNQGAPGRQAKLKIEFNTDCDLTSGSSFRFIPKGEDPCGILTIGNGIESRSNGIDIIGVGFNGLIDVKLSLPVDTLKCGDNVTLTMTSTPLVNPTQAGDTVIYNLPKGMKYNGSFTPGANCATCAVTTTTGITGNTIVKVSLASGVLANTPMAYSFDVGTDVLTPGCGSVPVSAQAKRNITPLMCMGVPCANSSVIVGRGTEPVVLAKPLVTTLSGSLKLVSDTSSAAFPTSDSLFYNVQLRNDGLDSTHGLKLKFFTDKNGNDTLDAGEAVYGQVVNSSLLPGQTKTLSGILGDGSGVFDPVIQMGVIVVSPCDCQGDTLAAPQSIVPFNYIPLAVDWIYFDAKYIGSNKVMLNWATASEDPGTKFNVERSVNGINFGFIGTVNGKGFNGENAYEYVDNIHGLNTNSVYYRIKEVSLGVNGSYTEVREVELLSDLYKKRDLSLYPNPTNHTVNVGLSVWNVGDKASITVVDLAGKVVMRSSMTSDNVKLDLSSLNQGMYLIQVKVGEELYTKRVTLTK